MTGNYLLHKKETFAAHSRGASTVEFAVMAPIVLTFMFGAIEFARTRQVVNGASFAAYEGCRQAIIPGGTAVAATAGAQQVMTSLSISSSNITVTPSTISNSTPLVTVSVAVNLANVGWVSPIFTKGITVTRSCTLSRELTQ